MDSRVWITQAALEEAREAAQAAAYGGAVQEPAGPAIEDGHLILDGLCFTASPMVVPAALMTDAIRADPRLRVEDWTDRPSPGAEADDGYRSSKKEEATS